MHNIYLPLHVWDRELDSRLMIAYLEACKGNAAIIGHEYNMAPLYKLDKGAVLFRAGQPLDHSIRGQWHKDISDRGGITITHDEEGTNNMPFLYNSSNRGTTVQLDLKKIRENPHKGSHQAFKDVTIQLAWSKMHRAYLSHQIEDRESRSIAVNRIESTSSVRFDLLGDLGKSLNRRLIYSIKNIFQNYILVLDNFSVDHRGSKGFHDPSQDLREAGYKESEIAEYKQKIEQSRQLESKARADFANIIRKIATKNPSINIIFRPHPVLDVSYWLDSFASFKNITIIEKGPIHAWIYGSVATIHSGCTTGLEAFAAGKTTFDVTDLISERSSAIKSSLIGYTKKNLKDLNDLVIQVNNEWMIHTNNPRMHNINHLADKSPKNTNILKTIDQALYLLQENSHIVAKRIKKELVVTNVDDIVGSDSAIVKIVKLSSQLQEHEGLRFLNDKKLNKYIEKQLPNQGKSRFCSAAEIELRINDIQIAFQRNGIFLPDIKVRMIGVNVFVLSA